MQNVHTIERVEKKYEAAISQGDLPGLTREINRYLPTHEFTPGERVTINHTLYFDSEDFSFLRKGLADKSHHIRIRARKYEYPSAAIVEVGYYWVELRTKSGEMTSKRRLKLDAADFQRFLEGEDIRKTALDYNGAQDAAESRKLYKTMRDIVQESGLKPVLLVSHNRLAFERDRVRLTVDWDIRYYQFGSSILRCENLKDLTGRPDGCDTALIMELKYSGEFPDWVSGLRQKYPIHPRAHLSKLDRGMKALLQGPFKSHEAALKLLKLIDAHREKDEQERLVAS